MPDAPTVYVDAEFAVLLPEGVVCQYHVSPGGGVPLCVSVTPRLAHCGEFDVGFPGSAGNKTTDPFNVTSSLLQAVEVFCAPII